MDTCRSCGARMTPDNDWCPQCYARAGAPPPAPSDPRVARPAPMAPAGRAGWRVEKPDPLPVYSRVKGGETSFGVVGRVMLSIGVVILGALGYVVIIGNLGIPPGISSIMFYLPVFGVVGGALWIRVWRPGRIDSRR